MHSARWMESESRIVSVFVRFELLDKRAGSDRVGDEATTRGMVEGMVGHFA